MNTSQIIQLSVLSIVGLFTLFIFPLNILYVYIVTRAYSIDNEEIIQSIPIVLNDICKGSQDVYNKIKIYLETDSRNDGSGYEADNESNENVSSFADSDSNEEQVNDNKATILDKETELISDNSVEETSVQNNDNELDNEESNIQTTLHNIENNMEIDNDTVDNKVYNLRKRPSVSDSEIELSNLRVNTSI